MSPTPQAPALTAPDENEWFLVHTFEATARTGDASEWSGVSALCALIRRLAARVDWLERGAPRDEWPAQCFRDYWKNRVTIHSPGVWEKKDEELRHMSTWFHSWSIRIGDFESVIASLRSQLADRDAVIEACKRFKQSFDKGFPNSLSAVNARDEIFEALAALDLGQK